MTRQISGRPETGEYAAYAQADFDFVDGDDAVAALKASLETTMVLLSPLDDDAVSGMRYAADKWTLKEVIGHLADDERIFAYRALSIARGDTRELPGFDEKAYMACADFEARTVESLLAELRAVRAATLTLLVPLSSEEWRRRGKVNGYEASVRGLAFHIAAHELHHLRVVRGIYLGR